MTDDGSIPTQATAKELRMNEEAWKNGDSRGSMVWFNQATMFQTAELDVPTIREAREMGMDTTCNVQDMLEKKRLFQKI
jgi:hypothetical protein